MGTAGGGATGIVSLMNSSPDTSSAPPPGPSLDGRRFTSVGPQTGDVGEGTVFTYHQEGDCVWAEYAGGAVHRGFLVGTRRGDRLDFRYTHLDSVGDTSSGHCISRVEELPDGRTRLHETWSWESRVGSGQSILEEWDVTPVGSRPLPT